MDHRTRMGKQGKKKRAGSSCLQWGHRTGRRDEKGSGDGRVVCKEGLIGSGGAFAGQSRRAVKARVIPV